MKMQSVLFISLFLFNAALAEWTPWMVSQPCTTSCGPGTMTRTRTCTGDVQTCQGFSQAVVPCVLSFCPDIFDCRRFGQDCANGAKCDCTTGECICPRSTFGYDCSLNLQNLSNSCNFRCANGGFCVHSLLGFLPGSSACLCSESFEGPSCDVKKHLVDVDCSHHAVSITYKPFLKFTGRIFIGGAEDDPTCFLSEQPSGDFSIAVPIDSGCAYSDEHNLQMVMVANHQEEAQYTRMVIVQHNPYVLTPFDEIYRVTCSFKEGVSRVTTSIETEDAGPTRATRSGLTFEKMMDAADFVYVTLKNSGGLKLDATQRLNVGDMIHLEVGVLPNQVFKHVRLDTCIIRPRNSTAPALFVVKDGCSSTDYCGLVADLMYTATSAGTAASVPIRAFKFNNGHNEELVIQCQLRVCRNPMDCVAKSCPKACKGDVFTRPADTLSRTRRQAEESASSAIVVMSDVKYPFIVWDAHTIETLGDRSNENHDAAAVCYLIPVVILGILFGACFLGGCLMTMLVWKRFKRFIDHQDVSISYASTASSVHDAASLCSSDPTGKQSLII